MAKLTNFIRRYTSIAATIDILRRKELPLLDPQNWDDRNDRYFMSQYKESKQLNGLYGLCASTCSETYHHWRVFTNAADGACIEINRQALEDRLAQVAGVRYGEIEYLKLEDVERLTTKDRDRMPFIKRVGFQPEDEYRIIAESDEAQRSSLPVELPISFVNRVYLNPWLPASISESVVKTLRELPGCTRLAISKSHLIDSGRWQKAGDKMVGKKTLPKLALSRSTTKPPR
jgi:hypothetical protein